MISRRSKKDYNQYEALQIKRFGGKNMRKLMEVMLTAGMLFSLSSCSSAKPQEAEKKEEETAETAAHEETPAAEEPAISAEDVEAALQGTWDMPDGSGSMAYDSGSFAVISGGQTLNGEYTIDMDEMVIAGRIKTSNGTLAIKTPFVYEDGTLKIFNNKEVELVKRN